MTIPLTDTFLLSTTISAQNRSEILAKGIPALSRSTGGTEVEGAKLNSNANDHKNGWGRSGGDYDTRWLHNDMREMAHPYTYKLYDELVLQGGMK